MAWLSLSLPQLVKTISEGSQLIVFATCARAVAMASLVETEKACPLLGFPKWCHRNGVHADATSGNTGVVAL